nr:hypothetical protein CFP56_05236 [Quercus suber]
MISLVAANRLLYRAHVLKSIVEQAFQRLHKLGTALADQLLPSKADVNAMPSLAEKITTPLNQPLWGFISPLILSTLRGSYKCYHV